MFVCIIFPTADQEARHISENQQHTSRHQELCALQWARRWRD